MDDKVVCEEYELGRSLYELANDHAEWSQSKFGGDATRGPIGSLEHLKEEAGEAVYAVLSGNREAIREELADCFLLILDTARRAGWGPMQLVEAAKVKMLVNRGRLWSRPNPDEPVKHVEIE